MMFASVWKKLPELLSMSSHGSVTHWISQLKSGDAVAVQRLWENYFPRLVGLARKKLHGTPRRSADEEDVALSAFDSFVRSATQGRFPQLSDRDNLWLLLVTITVRKALQLVRHEGRQKRGGTTYGAENLASDPTSLEQILSCEPTPDLAAQMVEEYQRLLAQLGSTELQAVAIWKMEGFTNGEIATKLGCVPRTVERKLALIRTLWDQE